MLEKSFFTLKFEKRRPFCSYCNYLSRFWIPPRRIPLETEKNKIVHAAMNGANDMTRVLVFGGKTGWIGQMMVELCKKEGK